MKFTRWKTLLLVVCCAGLVYLVTSHNRHTIDQSTESRKADDSLTGKFGRYEPLLQQPEELSGSGIPGGWKELDTPRPEHSNQSGRVSATVAATTTTTTAVPPGERDLVLNPQTDVDVIVNMSYVPSDDFSFQSLRKTLFELRHHFKPDLADYRTFGLNTASSELMHMDREVKDLRPSTCPLARYRAQNPAPNQSKVSIIVAFHNEAWSVLLRTLHSVLNRTPLDLIGEIIVVDDASTSESAREPLTDYVKALPKTRLLRTKVRQGPTRARMLGAMVATEPTLVFLDSDVECGLDWLEPLLELTAKEPSTFAVPVMDGIYNQDFGYAGFPDPSQGSLTWELDYVWKTVPQEWLSSHSPLEPIPTPTTSGCAMVVNKDYFLQLGGYDQGVMSLGGGGHVEVSLRAWMCGGAVKIVPCSHVGHVFRSTIMHHRDFRDAERDRQWVADQWMGPFAKYHRLTKRTQFEFTASQQELRKRKQGNLTCLDFQWFLQNHVPELMVPPPTTIVFGQMKVVSHKECITYDETAERLLLAPCAHYTSLQMFAYVESRQIVFRDDLCLALTGDNITLEECNHLESTQLWSYDPLVPNLVAAKLTGPDKLRPVGAFRLKVFDYNMCLSLHQFNGRQRLTVEECSYTNDRLYWVFTHKMYKST